MSSSSQSTSRHGTHRASHLRQVSTSTSATPPVSRPVTASSDTGTIQHDSIPQKVEKKCVLWVHDEAFSKEEVVLNLSLFPNIQEGDAVAIAASESEAGRRETQSQRQDSAHDSDTLSVDHVRERNVSSPHSPTPSSPRECKHDPLVERRYMFIARDMPKELKAKNPNLEISVAKHVADVFGFKHRSSCLLSAADLDSSAASHVEMAFRDEYLARSDMWRLTVQELTDRTIYKGQKILFMGTIKVNVTAVYINGKKVHSAFFSTTTKPIFRSESARYVLFIQMSREMWDFDSEGSGEIMFNKVINGFLPALFKKWAALKAKHLVSIVLFTRVEYDVGMETEFTSKGKDISYYTGRQSSGSKKPYKDFYRVVVSEMASGSWTTILYKLKREFKFFRRDTLLHQVDAVTPTKVFSFEDQTGGALSTQIEAEPSLAMHGNVLEAINLASSQFAHDYIDRDLIRTGISVVVITPCAGLFEVDYETLQMTTENLVGNGIGIDLVCLPKMPLHSVPLFKYKNPEFGAYHGITHFNPLQSEDSTPKQTSAFFGTSLPSMTESTSLTRSSYNERKFRMGSIASSPQVSEWCYAIPHWVDVSFWTGASQEIDHGRTSGRISKQLRGVWRSQKSNDFAVRCKMYELEMASVMENAMSEISIAPLQQEAFFPMMVGGPTEILPRVKVAEQSKLKIQRNKQYAAFHEFVSGPSKALVDRHSSEDFKRFMRVLEAFDLANSQIEQHTHHARRNTDELRIHRSVGDPSGRRSSVEPSTLFGTSVSSTSGTIAGVALMATSASGRSRQNSQLLEEQTRPRQTSSASIKPITKTISSRPTKFSRQISFGKHGFSLAAPKAAVSVVQTDTASATVPASTTSKNVEPRNINRSASQSLGETASVSSRPPSVRGDTMRNSEKLELKYFEEEHNTPSKAITLQSAVQSLESKSQFTSRSIQGSFEHNPQNNKEPRNHMLNSLRSDDNQKLYTTKLLADAVPELPATLSPTTAMSPWLTILNPANPAHTDIQSQYRRWHHIFPKRVHAKTMKWKSLCCPASVPLTTNEFPTKQQLETEYQQQPYTICHNFEDDNGDRHQSREQFFREMISLRLSHGYQVVVGSALADAFGQKSLKVANVFRRDHIAEDGASVFMSIGNVIHQLSCVNESDVEVNMFLRKPIATVPSTSSTMTQTTYKPAVKTTLAPDFHTRSIVLGKSKDEYNWNLVDSYIAGLNKEMTENLRFWRARFVLIPMQRPTRASRKLPGEDDEEETRLEGIKKLTQIWQRHRVLTASEKQELGARSIRDPNPLDIVYKTEDPSLAVTAELDSMLPILGLGGNGTRKGQLIETERFRKGRLDVSALAAAMQAPVEKGGIPIQTRPWHWKHHHNCFIGLDMTTWLIENFADIHTREEAVEYGNKLMVKDELNKITEYEKDNGKDRANDIGIFIHVDKRHAFRDGQYFYRIIDEYSSARPESRGGWFSHKRRDMTVPATPPSERSDHENDSARPLRSRSSSQHDEFRASSSGTSTPTASSFAASSSNNFAKPKVALSKVMSYDVDHRKRSYRPERINLHYDRLHNPDNCYHIRIDWVGVTAKLIEDAITSWAATAERYGLRLVEAPIGEACSIGDVHPFRSPYTVKLALQPPEEQPLAYFDGSFFPRDRIPYSGRHYYHKHIMKKFNFVLDIEAAKNFPANVDVTYSWGKPDFRYTQYIHRSGIVLAQITDEGDFLLLANRLYNNRTAAAREAERNLKNDLAHHESSLARGPTRMSSSMYGNASVFSDRTTPAPSPALRPTITAHNTSSTTLFSSPLLRPTFPSLSNLQHLATSDVLGTNYQNPRPEAILTPEVIKAELEAFCGDTDALEQYFQEVYEKASPPTAPTPPLGASVFTVGRSPSVSSVSNYGGNERDKDVPTLGLPPNVLSREMEGKIGGIPKLSNMKPSWGRRGSVQIFGRSESRDDASSGSDFGATKASRKDVETDSSKGSISESTDEGEK